MSRLNPVVPATAAVAAVIVVAVCLAMLGTATPANAINWCTFNYPSIQAAIDAAGDGDTVQVAWGTYYENLVITKNITLQGGWSTKCTTPQYDDPKWTVIDGGAAGSVVSITGGSTATLELLTLTNGQSQKGGGVYASGSSPTLNNVVVTGNVISPTGSTYPEWAYGGGVFVEDGTITLRECDITYNTSYPAASDLSFGGGLALDWVPAGGASTVIEGTRIMSNSNPSDSNLLGGGLFLDAYTEVTFQGTDNQIAYNDARGGGGIYMYGNVDLEGVLILDNHAQFGGGLFLGSGYNGGRIANNYVLGNTAALDAPSVFATDSGVELANNTIVGNLSGSGAGIDVDSGGSGTLELINNIVISHAIGIRMEDESSVILSHNDVWGNTTDYVNISAGSGDISIDPEFVDPDSDDYHLAADSPCVNAGDYIDWLFFDYEGDRRTGALLDIGADEYGSDHLLFVPAALKRYTP